MRRKLIKQGINGLTCYIPKKWADANRLLPRDEVQIEQYGNSLIITPVVQKEKQATEIELLDETESSTRVLITTTYRKGYDKITVKFKTKTQFETLKYVVQTRLIGFEIIEQYRDHCIIENITEPAFTQFETLFLKIFYNMKLFADVSKEHVLKQQPSQSFEEIQNRIQQYDNFCRRAIAKNAMPRTKNEPLWAFLTKIVHASRELYHLNKIEIKKAQPQLEEFLNEIQKMVDIMQQAYMKNDIDLLSLIHVKEKELIYIKGYKLLNTNSSPELYHTLVCIRQTYLCLSNLSQIII